MTLDELRMTLAPVGRMIATADTGWLLAGPPVPLEDVSAQGFEDEDL